MTSLYRRPMHWGCVFLFALGLAVIPAAAQDDKGPSSSMSCADMEEFMRTAKIGAMRNVPKGVTLPHKATLEDGKIKHDVYIQTVDEKKASFQTQRGTELNFRDFWGYNVAGYELAKALGINMVTPYVERKVGGKSASLSWSIDTMMDEVERMKRKENPPNLDSWNKEMYVIRVFNQLIANTDDNLTNFLIDHGWHLWMIDFTRAFRTQKNLLNQKNLVQCDRKMLEKIRRLDEQAGMLQDKLVKGHYLTKMELDGVLARSKKIVEFFDDEVKKKGEGAVLFDLPRSGQPCGAGI